MSHSLNRIWVHAVFSTKKWQPLIVPSIKVQVHQMIRNELEKMNCQILAVNGMPNHIHLLFLLNSNYSIAQVIKQVKGASSANINRLNLLSVQFAWQVGYGAFSVSKSILPRVIKYIENQEEHHKHYSFDDEYERLTRTHEFIRGN